jgi:heptosyltransferase-2
MRPNGEPVRAEPEAVSGAPRILIVRAGAIGDTLMVTPLLRALRRTYPRSHLVFVCSQRAHDVVRHNPHLDQVIALGYRHLPTWLSFEKLRALRQLRSLNLDWALALESHPRLVALARRAGAARTIAYGDGDALRRSGVERASFDLQRHCVENYLGAAHPLGVQSAGFETEFHYPLELDATVERRLAIAGIGAGDPLVGVHAGWGGRSHALGQTRLKSWPAQNFAAVVHSLVARFRARVVLTGSSSDAPLNESISRLAAVSCANFAGKLSLLETAALIRRMNLYLTVDSGPAHMAAALGTPLLTLWGPAIFEQVAPLPGLGPVRILYHRVPCAPCYGTPLMKSCRDNICMKHIEVAEVQQAIEQLWSRQAEG